MLIVKIVLCHAPRERVSWNAYDLAKGKFEESVTLHVSVWVEIHNTVCVHNRRGVTLHVSVWVEITNTLLEHIHITVTLHVSVWVEIVFNCDFKLVYYRHAPREHVSWNIFFQMRNMPSICHAPRERVSWNQILPLFCLSNWRHAPRERVSWNLNISRAAIQLSRHAPRERVSWNINSDAVCRFHRKSRSTWACELKWYLL